VIGSTRNIKAYIYNEFVDMRKSFDGLSGIVSFVLEKDPYSGHMFLFLGKSKRIIKILYWDGTGACIFHKRLAKGGFAVLFDETKSKEITQTELMLFIEGAKIKNKFPLSPNEYLFT
jgi:transposase